MQFFKDESGQGLVEYALILAAISVVAIATLKSIGQSVDTKLGEVNTALTATPAPTTTPTT